MNSFLLLCDVFSFVFWKNPRLDWFAFEINWPLTDTMDSMADPLFSSYSVSYIILKLLKCFVLKTMCSKSQHLRSLVQRFVWFHNWEKYKAFKNQKPGVFILHYRFLNRKWILWSSVSWIRLGRVIKRNLHAMLLLQIPFLLNVALHEFINIWQAGLAFPSQKAKYICQRS